MKYETQNIPLKTQFGNWVFEKAPIDATREAALRRFRSTELKPEACNGGMSTK